MGSKIKYKWKHKESRKQVLVSPIATRDIVFQN